jgi:MYXO-CTERM domain-containing protein
MRSEILGALALSIIAGTALATDPSIPLNDRSASAIVRPVGPGAGMTSLTVDGGPNRLINQSFWFRTASMNREQNVGTLQAQFGSTDTNPFVDNRADTASATYFGSSFSIEVTWQLRGGLVGSGRADVGESIVITNQSQGPTTISFFQYSHWALSDTDIPLDVINIHGAGFNTASQTGASAFVSETVVSPQPAGFVVGSAANLLGLLSDDNADNFGLAGPTSAGPGSVAWIYQWNFTIPMGGSVTITKDKSLVPTPGAAALMGLGGLLAIRRRR